MIYIARNRLYVLTGCSWKFGSNNEAIHTVSICRDYEEPVPAVINGLSISWVTESCWVGWLSGWTLRWSEAVPVRQPGDWYLCPYLSEKFGAICDEHGWSMFATLKLLILWYAARSTISIPQRSCGEVRACDPSATMFIWKLGRSNTCHRWKSNYPMPKVSGRVKQILSGLPWMKIDGVQISSRSLYKFMIV